MRLVRPIVVATALSLAPAAAHAAMTYAPDTGTVARSRGGAFTAAANDPMAIVYNPAGFADQKQMQVYVDITALQLNSKFERATDSFGSYKAVTNSGPTKISPNIIFSQPIAEGLVWHVGAYGAVGVNSKYPESGGQRYTTTFQNPQQLSYSAGVSYRINPMFSAGLTLGGMYITNQTTLFVSGVGDQDPALPPQQDPATDYRAELDVANAFTPIGVVGFKVTPVEGWEIGLSYRPSVTAKLAGTYKAYDVNDNEIGDEDVTLVVPLPQIIRTGVRYVQPRWDAEIDFVLEDWSARDEDVLEPDDGQLGTNPPGDVPIARDGGPAFSVRLGGTFKLSEIIALHGGLLHETAAIPAERMSVNVFDAPKTGLAFGGSYSFATRYTVSANLTYIMLQTTEVDDTKVRQRGAFTTREDSLALVGNGTYSGAYVMTGVSFQTRF